MGAPERGFCITVKSDASMKYMIFDLDNTLYPREIGLFKLVDRRIHDYMRITLGMNDELTGMLRLRYRDEYGSTLGGLMIHHNVNPDAYLDYVHDIELDELLSANASLWELLERISIDKVIFTNGSSNHAENVLRTLGVDNCFSQIFDIKFMDYMAKPSPEAYQKVLDVLQVEGRECIMVEDLARNLLPAKKLGMTTVLIAEEQVAGIDFIIEDIFSIDKVLAAIGLNQ